MIQLIMDINKYNYNKSSLNLLNIIDLIKKSFNEKKDKKKKVNILTNFFFNKKKGIVEKELKDYNPKYDDIIQFSPIYGQDEYISQKCIICTKNPSTVLFTKCAHLILCNDCYNKHDIESFPTKCILCKIKSKIITVKYHKRITI